MARYNYWYVNRLYDQAAYRFDRLKDAMKIPLDRKIPQTNHDITIDGLDLRLAVDDFKNILAEIRKLK